MNSQAKRIEGLDGLRALACLAVLGVHFQQITGVTGQLGPLDLKRFLENGNTGVSLFFALSGFLLSLPFWTGQLKDASAPWLVGYIRRRLVRILPPYYVCLTVLVIQQRRWESSDDRLNTLAHYLFVHNFSERFFYSISPPFWTLAVQAQFYVVLPLVFWLLMRVTSRKHIWLAVILALSLATYGLHYFLMVNGDRVGVLLGIENLVSARPKVFSHSVAAHLPHLFWGVLAARVFVNLNQTEAGRYRAARCDAIFLVAVLSILTILATPLDELFQIPFGRYNLPYVPALITVLLACTPFTQVALRMLELAPIRRLGEVSFGVYVYHLPCMRLIEREMPRAGLSAGDNWISFAVASLILSVIVASISYYAFELPLLHRGKRPPMAAVT